MKEKTIYKRKFKEAADVSKIIATVIDTNWSKDNESQMKNLQLMKGIATNDDPLANKFMKKIDDFTSGLKKDDFKESVLKEQLEDIDDVYYIINQYKKSKLISRFDNSDVEEVYDNYVNSKGRMSVEQAVERYFNIDKSNY